QAVACRPIQTTCNNLAEAGHHLLAMGQGGVGKRLLAPLHGPPAPAPGHGAPLDLADFEAELRRLTGDDLQPACVQLYVDGSEALAALEGLMAQATTSIDVLMFYWENDEVGEQIARRIAERASPHLRVRVLVDGGGNLVFGQPD